MIRFLLVLCLSVISLSACNGKNTITDEGSELTQAMVDQLAETLDIQYSVVVNKGSGGCTPQWGGEPCFVADIHITSQIQTQARGWTIYYSQSDKFEESHDREFIVEHINGDLVSIKPGDMYQGFKTGETKIVRTISNGLVFAEAKMMPNYYISADGLEARVISSTKLNVDIDTGLEERPYATNIDPKTQFQRENDNTPVATSGYLYHQNKDIQLDSSAVAIGVIPKPKSMTITDGVLDLSMGYTVKGDEVSVKAAGAAIIRFKAMGFRESKHGHPLGLDIDSTLTLPKGSYSLSVKASGISIVGVDPEGLANGVRSLVALVEYGSKNIPLVEIYDEPRYQFRGMHVDLARNFHSKDFVLDLIEQMATYKLNKLHLHMGDDEGWRLEIRGLPALTQVGAFRCHDLTETRCLLPQLGSGSDPDFTSAVNGFYTIADYKEILEAATARHIQVIPSFDMPGHSRAVIKSMEARYRRLMAEGKEAEANRYRLIDPEDTTKYYSIQFYTDNTINVCIQSTYDFIDKVIDEVKLVHQEAGHPLTRYHIGADETAGAWIESPACKKYMEANDIHDVERLGPHFIERLSAQLIQKGIEVGGWSDGLSHTNFDKMPERVQSNIWDVLAWGGSASAHKQVNAGWEVVLSTPDALYFDFPHEADPKESGYYWGTRRVNTRKVFSFMPGNIPVHAEIWKSPAEQPFVIDDTLRLDAHGDVISGPMKKGKSIAGIQGQLWSETARSDDWAEYQIYPRFMALAERAWSKPAWEPDYNYSGAVYSHETKLFNDDLQAKRDKDWARFTSILAGKEFSKLDAANIFYRIPTVGAVINSNGVLSANIIFPGMAIEYRVGSSDWIEYSEPVTLQNYEVGTEVSVRSRSMDGTRYGRSLVVSN